MKDAIVAKLGEAPHRKSHKIAPAGASGSGDDLSQQCFISLAAGNRDIIHHDVGTPIVPGPDTFDKMRALEQEATETARSWKDGGLATTFMVRWRQASTPIPADGQLSLNNPKNSDS